MEYINDEYVLSNGRMFYANCGIVGISSDGKIFNGYDGGIHEEFTKEEKKEICDYMISLWTKWSKEWPQPKRRRSGWNGL